MRIVPANSLQPKELTRITLTLPSGPIKKKKDIEEKSIHKKFY